MISEIYKNAELYYNFMNDFLQRKINSWEFRTEYLSQRHEDLDKNKTSGYSDYYLHKILWGNEKKFEEEYSNILYEKGKLMLKEYEQGAKDLDIKGEIFFMGIWDFIDIPIIEFYPSDREGFDPKFDIDEKMLKEIVQAAFDVLERNKDRWMTKKQETQENPKEDNGQKI